MSTSVEFISLEKILDKIKELETDTILMVIDDRVWSLYKEKLSLGDVIDGKKVHIWTTPRGEEAKRISEYEKCIESFLELKVHRDAHLISFGGGATSDFAGFVASTLLRGIKWSVVTTTLLGMVDASIGGKVALNSRFGKNLIGSFHSPENVWVNIDFLETLPEEEILSGKGEIIKYAFLSKEIYENVINKVSLDKIIKGCISYKLSITNADPLEENYRKILNFGHTFGHAIERAYSLKHGIAILWGMVLYFKIFGCSDDIIELKKIKDALSWGEEIAPWNASMLSINRMVSYLEKDKKRINRDLISLVGLESIGKPILKEHSFSDIKKRLKNSLDESTSINL